MVDCLVVAGHRVPASVLDVEFIDMGGGRCRRALMSCWDMRFERVRKNGWTLAERAGGRLGV
jgi:hypothetical protein